MEFRYIIIYFFIYSVIGYLIETIYCSIDNGKFMKRGFLFGPYCPIYGFGSLIILFSTQAFADNAFLVFIFAFFSTSILEYITSVLIEKTIKVELWDYSHMKFNINGRVCLLNSFLFGVMGLVLQLIAHPFISGYVRRINIAGIISLSSAIVTILIIDLVFSLFHVSHFRQSLGILEKFNKQYHWFVPSNLELSISDLRTIVENDTSDEANHIREDLSKLEKYQLNLRYINNYPSMKINEFKDSFTKFRDQFTKKK